MATIVTDVRRHVLPAIEYAGSYGSWPRVTAVLIVAGLASCIGLGFAPWQQSVSGSGKVVAFRPMERQQTIDAPVEGRIVKWHVVEGTRVSKGDPIADMADLDPALPARIQLERTAVLDRIRVTGERQRHLEERIDELEKSLKNELSAADFRIQQARDRLRATEQSLDAATAKVTVARQNLERHRALFPKGLVSKRNVEVAEADNDTANAELRRAEAQLNESRNFLRTVELERARGLNTGTATIRDASASRESARGDLASAQQSLQPVEVRLNRQLTQTIVAPSDGTIFRVLAQPGSAVVKSGEGIASIVPDVSATVAEVWIVGNDVPLIATGRKVRLQFEGWPAVQFVGWPSVAVGTFGGIVRLVDATDDGNGKFRLLVEPDPEDAAWPESRYLRQGARVKGWVLLSTVPIGFEVWRQFNGFPPSIGSAPTTAKEAKAK